MDFVVPAPEFPVISLPAEGGIEVTVQKMVIFYAIAFFMTIFHLGCVFNRGDFYFILFSMTT